MIDEIIYVTTIQLTLHGKFFSGCEIKPNKRYIFMNKLIIPLPYVGTVFCGHSDVKPVTSQHELGNMSASKLVRVVL